ncbi:hypothetical protein HMPREF9618_00897 [Cutibacterium acnes HL082PA1]|nr:hypothetical protein HMPREF9618_00897 [Cutibacterium acnes HL082PA1]EFT54998.1 hypothetical protein HMPREF9610_01926 [Cutibacterium acnes HL027PA2]
MSTIPSSVHPIAEGNMLSAERERRCSGTRPANPIRPWSGN